MSDTNSHARSNVSDETRKSTVPLTCSWKSCRRTCLVHLVGPYSYSAAHCGALDHHLVTRQAPLLVRAAYLTTCVVHELISTSSTLKFTNRCRPLRRALQGDHSNIRLGQEPTFVSHCGRPAFCHLVHCPQDARPCALMSQGRLRLFWNISRFC